MSTKIYNGYKLPAMSFNQLQKFIDKLRVDLNFAKDKLILEAIANKIYKNFDDLVFGNLTELNWYHRFSQKDLKDRKEPSEKEIKYISEDYLVILCKRKVEDSYLEIYKTRQRDPSHDFQFSASFIGKRNKTYVTIYSERKEFDEIFESMKEVTPYPYWDNTDPPEDITYSKWKARGKEWEEVLNGFSGPGLIGLNFSLIDERYLPLYNIKNEDVLAAIPSKEERAKKIARTITDGQVMEKLKLENPEKYKDGHISCYFEARDFITETEEGKALLQKNYDEILPKIVEITPEILKMNFKTLKENYGTTSIK